MAIVPDRWALLKFQYEGPYARVELTDQRGGSRAAYWKWAELDFDLAALSPVADHVSALAQDLPDSRVGPHALGSIPLAVFLDLPRFLWGDRAFIRRLTGALSGPLLSPERVQFVLFAGRLERQRTPFALPFDVLADGAAAQAAVQSIRTSSWALGPLVAQYGLTVTDIVDTEADSLEGELRARARDVLITSSLHGAFDVCADLPLERRPRLIIVLDATPDRAFMGPPDGVALVLLENPAAADPRVGDILFGFIHDLPLHEAVKVAERLHAYQGPLHVIADPWTNQSLRIRDAFIGIHTEAERLEARLPSATMKRLAIGEIVRPAVRATRRWAVPKISIPLPWKGAGRAAEPETGPADVTVDAEQTYAELVSIGDRASEARSFPIDFEDFQQEGRGLEPLAERSATLETLQKEADVSIEKVGRLIANPAVAQRLSSTQSRAVDVALQRIDTSPLLSFVEPGSTLAAGATYRLKVHVGARLPGSLMRGQEVPLDPLLPAPDDTQGHVLDVVVQPKSFAAVDVCHQQLVLPRFGGTAPIYFGVRAPESPGPASLRVHVYYRNHLIQSFLLTAVVTTQEEQVPETPTEVTLEYTRVDRLVLDHVQPRAMSLGVNDNGSKTHGLMLKGDGASGEVSLQSSAFSSQLDAYRKLLDKAARSAKNPAAGRMYPKLAPGDPVPVDVADTIRELATRGQDLYDALFSKADRVGMRKRLVELQDQANQTIQIVRFDETFVFPWTILYDYGVPASGGPVPVCLGMTRGADGRVKACEHRPGAPVICVNGFWGVRHYLEDLLGKGDDHDLSVTRPARDAVRVVCGDSTIAAFETLPAALRGIVKAPHFAEGPLTETSLLDLLWATPPARPAILIVLGHMETAGASGDFPRVVLTPQKEWLRRQQISQKVRRSAERWTQPRTIVMLMACESAQTSAATVNDFVSALATAGAAAVVGTEAVVPSGLAADSARELTALLWTDRRTLGEAMTTLRRRLLAEGNPLAFVFHAVGNADLALD